MIERAKRSTVLVAGYATADRLRIEAAISKAQWLQVVCFVDDRKGLFDTLSQAGKCSPFRSAPFPSLILINIDGLGEDGQQVLADIKSHPGFRCIPVVVVSEPKEKEDVLKFYRNGVSGYIPLPDTVDEWVEVMAGVKKYWFDTVILPAGIRG